MEDHDDVDSVETASIIISSQGRPASAICGTKVPNYEYYRTRLAPLAQLEDRLISLLSTPEEDEPVHVGPTPPAWNHFHNNNNAALSNGNANGHANGRQLPTLYIPQRIPHPYSSHDSPTVESHTTDRKSKRSEVAVHTTINWKKAFSLGGKEKSPKSAHTGEIAGWWEDPHDPVHTLNACGPAMLQLWKDPNVRQRLEEHRLRLEESSGL